ncbi:hypothetical protein EV421DRAFT_1905512 [Armillaria borealis]|uniref:Uncharacterized protein n=1 Tax=Armillaria borealis TaxID=47425 RepID=A0AA39MML8_9AGAR|nr:hypothetical protein EV421DRAFT_1905512 [Armillaria borealis]
MEYTKVIHRAKSTSLAESSASKGNPSSKATSTPITSGRSRFPIPTLSSPLGPSTSSRNKRPNTSLNLLSSSPPFSSPIASRRHIHPFPPLPPLDFDVGESSDGEDGLMPGSSADDNEVIVLDDPPVSPALNTSSQVQESMRKVHVIWWIKGTVELIHTFLPVPVGSGLQLQSHRACLGERGVEKIGTFERYIVRKNKWNRCSWEDEIYTHYGECIAIKGDDVPHPKDWEDWVTTLVT